MAPTIGTPYNPSESNAPSSSLPEHMHGLIDLATLTDMNRFLGESLSQDDLALAGWIKENFLYEPLEQTSRPIRTPEGFSKLDHAYRRVRSLTNKVQDKWPFFDQNFKIMSTTTVRNNSRGEISPGVTFQQKHSAPPVDGVNPTNASPTPALQVPFGAHQLGRHRSQRKDPVRSSEHVFAPLPSKLLTPPKLSPEKDGKIATSKSTQSGELISIDNNNCVDYPQNTEPFSHSTGPAPSQPEPALNSDKQTASDASQDIAPIQTDKDPKRNTEELRAASIDSDWTCLRDADGGKVRGMNGRFQPKNISAPTSDRTTGIQRRAAKAKPSRDYGKCKYTQISRNISAFPKPSSNNASAKSIAGKEAMSGMTQPTISIPANSYDSIPDMQSPSTPFGGDYVETTEAMDLPVSGLGPAAHDEETIEFMLKASKPRVRFSDVISEDSSPYKLAVESDPVVSNLDRLPPNSLRRAPKRKSPPNSQSSHHKRTRQFRSGEASVATETGTPNGADVAQVTVHGGVTSKNVEKIGVTTRRSARRSAATDTDIITVPKSKPINDEPAKDLEEPKFDDEDATMVDVDADAEHTTAVKEKLAPVLTVKASKARPKAVHRDTSPRATRSRGSLSDTNQSAKSTSASTSDHLLDLAISQMDKAESTSSQRSLMPSVIEAPAQVNKSSSKKSAMPPVSSIQEALNDSTAPPDLHSKSSPPLNHASHMNNATSAPAPITNDVQQTTANDIQQTVAAGPEVGKVEYFARVYTITGPIDVPMSADKIKDEEEQLLNKYAAFVSKKGTAPIDFDMYREIYVSTKW